MAHFAKLNDYNIVMEVHVVNNDVLDPNNEEQSGIEFLTQWSGGYTNWKQTSYNANFRLRFASKGGSYDEENDIFWDPKPFPSWVKDFSDFKWKAPIPHPNNNYLDGLYIWDEDSLSWVEFN